ncbi:helix-turn-helix transcriptional regulator [Gaetbulibacter jejuensis]|uniref:helix-turn-helix transcriptional regulator n=1 Tax=Gaetbulibacter jejuensis TaxID=584607 RepID=UPI0030088FE7
MKYKKVKPNKELEPFIHFYWELKGDEKAQQWERVFPDGCAGVFMNLGEACLTDNGSVSIEFGKTYVVGAMTSYKDSFINSNTHLIGVCLKPATFSNFYSFCPKNTLTNNTVEFEKSNSFNLDKVFNNQFDYFDQFFSERIKTKNKQLHSVINDIHTSNGQISVQQLSKRNSTSVRHLERNFKKLVGISPKEYSNIIRFNNALSLIKKTNQNQSLLDIAFECGYYDHSHLTNEIKRNTGLSPSQLKMSLFYKAPMIV